MAYEFKISGEIVKDGDEWQEYGSFSPAMLDMYLRDANGEALFIDINSIGGNVDAGFTMFTRLRRYASKNNVEITTRTDGYVASIATAVFLAGDKRIVNEFMQPFVHNPSVDAFLIGLDAEELEEISKSLEKTQDLLADFYSKNTKMSKEDALKLMDADTWISAEDCIEFGFATEIEELSAAGATLVASIKTGQKQKTKFREMAKKQNLAQKLAKAVLGIGTEGEKEAKKILDGAQNEIEFPEVDADAAIKVGDKANIEGKVAQGEYVIPSPEDSEKTWKLVFDKGVLENIIKDGETEGNSEDIVDSLRKEVENLKTSLKEAKTSISDLKKNREGDQEKIKKYEDALTKIAKLESGNDIDTTKDRKASSETVSGKAEKGSRVKNALKNVNFELEKK